jgi:hypothetical protein
VQGTLWSIDTVQAYNSVGAASRLRLDRENILLRKNLAGARLI